MTGNGDLEGAFCKGLARDIVESKEARVIGFLCALLGFRRLDETLTLKMEE